MAKKDKKKSHPSLLLKALHELYLMRMDICQRKGVRTAFLGIKADRDSLYCSDIIYGTALFKICQGDVPVFLVHADRGNGSGDFLDQCQSLFPVLFICPVYQLLQSGAAQASAVPGCQ